MKIEYLNNISLIFKMGKSKSNPFRDRYTLNERRSVAKDILDKHKDRIPIIIFKDPSSKVPDISKHKFLVPRETTIGKLIYEIRKHITLKSTESIFLFINDVMPPVNELIETIYNKYKDTDGFLYITYNGENTFGSS